MERDNQEEEEEEREQEERKGETRKEKRKKRESKFSFFFVLKYLIDFEDGVVVGVVLCLSLPSLMLDVVCKKKKKKKAKCGVDCRRLSKYPRRTNGRHRRHTFALTFQSEF